ncbi:MAG: T9SS type A sorting domain-containing protein, partial [Bacteroidia bacterium]|nr:T9SS type A sorting domain-containing protein [Bacteroidia bacterium]
PTAQIQGDYAPATGDLDGDGDDDLLLGVTSGKLWYFQNLGTDTAQFFLQTTDYFGIDHGLRSVPQLKDYDNDGDLDLFIGYDNGKIALYQNSGSLTAPNWTLITTQWGKIRYQNPQISIFGNAKPFLFDADSDGQLELFLGTIDGLILMYDNLTFNATDSFVVSGIFAGKDWGMNASLTAFRYAANDSIAWFIGGQRGGIEAWTSTPGILSSGHSYAQNPFVVYPIPANHTLTILSSSFLQSVRLLELTGKEIPVQYEGGIIQIPSISNGIYILEMQHLNQQRFYQKIWVQQD